MSIELNWVYDFACVYFIFVPCEASVLVDSTFVFLYFLYRKIYSCLVSYAACV